MRFNFRKVSALLTSAVMLGSSAGIAAAANYPAPFISGGVADVAIVYGSGTGVSPLDAVQAGKISTDLQARLGTGGGTSTTTSVTGEASALFSSTKIYVNDSLNGVKTVLTKTELPTVLKDGSFTGDVDATYTQRIDLGSNPRLAYDKQPTSSDDPTFGFTLGTTAATSYAYNATVTFNKAIMFNHSDSEGEEIVLFGQKFTVASATDGSKLILLKSAEKVFLSSDANPSQEVTIQAKTYTIELVAATDTSATIKVTDSDGKSEQKEISEAASKKINGVTIAVNNADESTALNKLTAEVIAGAEKVTLQSGSSVQFGEDDKNIEGTSANITGGIAAATAIRVAVSAPNSDKDSVNVGQTFVDPVFGTFKLDFSSLNNAENSSSREDIVVKSSGDDKMTVTFKDHAGYEKAVQFAINRSDEIYLQHDTDGRNITVKERGQTYRSEMLVVGNEQNGYLLKVTTITNQTSGTGQYTDDAVKFTDVFSGDTYTTTITADGAGTVTVGGKVYDVNYRGSSTASEDARWITVGDRESSGENQILFPTIQTSKGAKVAFYTPTIVNFSDWDSGNEWDGASSEIAGVMFPDGDGYETITIGRGYSTTGNTTWNITDGSTISTFNVSQAPGGGGNATTVQIGTGTGMRYNFTVPTGLPPNASEVKLIDVDNAGNINDPALIIWEEKDDNNEYQALIVTLETGNTGDDGIGVDTVRRTWFNDTIRNAVTMASDSKKTKEADLWGSIITLDTSDSDQTKATISYPDEQVYANIYVAANDAEITSSGGTTGGSTQLGNVIVTDSEINSVKGKNVVVIGGSCINSAAATLLGGTYCGAAFTENTGIGSGQYLIKGYDGGFTSGKVALLVAGYEKEDTANAATYLTKQTVDTISNYKGTTATTAELVTTTA